MSLKKTYVPSPNSLFNNFKYNKNLIKYSTSFSALPGWHKAGSYIIQEFTRIKLIETLKECLNIPLFKCDPMLSDDDLLKSFANFIFTQTPAITFISENAFTEVEALKILLQISGKEIRVFSSDPEISAGTEGAIVPQFEDGDLIHISFHESPTLFMADEVAYRLSVTDSLAIFGCPSLHNLPQELAALNDITLDLTSLSINGFKKIFAALFKNSWPDEYSLNNQKWPEYAEEADFYTALTSYKSGGFSPKDNKSPLLKAAKLIEHSVQTRLLEMRPKNIIPLSELKGMGQAKEAAACIIDDLKAAKKGEIAWKDMEKGILLAGPRGTGKEKMALLIANESNLPVISTNATEWASKAFNFSEHVGALQRAFSKARKYSPSILYIEELESIGHSLASYGDQATLQLINALIYEIQNADPLRPVFVIASCRHVENIDPSLLQRNMLSEIIYVPYPDHHALAAILRHHLAPYKAKNMLSDDVRYDLLGALALSLTAADIRKVVRDSAQRAKKLGEKIHHHTVAAILTKRPLQDYSDQIDMENLKNTAYHEAGHAVMVMNAREYSPKLNMISVVPRTDGKLGFVASTPPENKAMTKKAFEEYLQIIMAGRAAEEIIFGKEAVTSGAAGPSAHSDLAVATKTAARMVCHHGMGRRGKLSFTSNISSEEDIEEIREILDKAYEDTVKFLRQKQDLLEALTAKLLVKYEMHHDEVIALAEEYGMSPSKFNEQ